MEEADIAPLTYGYLLRYLGQWILISTCSVWKRKYFWGVTPFDQETNPCPYRLGEFMSKCCFNAITRELRFTKTIPPPYVYTFWKIHHMAKAWNYHTTSIFLVSWEICLNKSMSIWHIRWTHPGWILCPRNPHKFGNEWYTACCALNGIFVVVELIEGKPHPCKYGPLEFEDLNRKTVGLLLYMMKIYFTTSRYVIIYSGFCVLKGLLIRVRKVFLPVIS